ncbi:phospholipase D-like domain-containing protein [Methylocella silvestris]|nr:phospholipase D-like domain-containing protein [Methylocella silvestris]
MTLKKAAVLAGVSIAALALAFGGGAYVGRRLPAGTVLAGGAGATTIHFAPAENLERVDVELIRQATTAIDFAAYVLTDVAVTRALTERADHGVVVRLYLYEDQLPRGGAPLAALQELRATPGVETRIKSAGALMHLKGYQIDGRLLRTGSANFSASGLKRQDNDLIVIEARAAADAFKRNFEAIWARAQAAAVN